jgi:hypothetical protein
MMTDTETAEGTRPESGQGEEFGLSGEIGVLPSEDREPRPVTGGATDRLLGIEELCDRLQIRMSEVTRLVEEGRLRYFLFPNSFGIIRFDWNQVLQDLQKLQRVGDPKPEVESEILEAANRTRRWRQMAELDEEDLKQPQTVS